MKKIILPICLLFSCSYFSQIQKGQDIDGEAANDGSGCSVSMPDANTVGIGAPSNSGNGSFSGHVRVYRWNGVSWVQKGIDIDGEAAEDQSGCSVSMPDSNTIAIGANYNDGGATNAGHVRVFRWNGVSWVQKGIDIDGEAGGDCSGCSVSMPDNNTIAIGARLHDGNGNDAGYVRVFKWNGANWIQKGTSINGEAAIDLSGYSVSMPDTSTVAISAILNDGNGSDAGHVRVYRWNGVNWVQKGNDIDGETAGDWSGYSISMPDNKTVAIGAPFNSGSDTNAGHVRIYKWNGVSWIQKGTDIDGESAEDQSGFSVSMSDSNTLAIGARYNDGNGNNSGHIRIYGWNGSSWVKKGADIDGESVGDRSGFSVSMPDTNTVAIGANGNNGNGSNAGHVRVYSLSNSIYFDTILNTFACDSFLIPSGDSTLYASGTYFDTVNDTAYIINLTVNNTVFNVDSMYFCNGDSISVSGIWLYDDTVIVDTLISVSGCDSIITYIISEKAVVPVLDLGANTILCQNDNLMLNPGVYDHYLWNTGDTSATILVDGNTLGTGSFIFWAEVFDTILDCSDRDSITINIVNCVDNEKVHYQSLISISPNPLINEKLTINFGSFNEACFIDIFDASGKFIARSKRRENEKIKEIKLDQEKGIYFLKFTTNNESFTHKLIKE